MKRKKIMALVLAATMIAGTALTGCGSKENDTKDSAGTSEETGSTDEKTIKWLSTGPGEDSWEGLTKPIIEAFEKETGIHVETEFYSFNDLFEVIETKAASGNATYVSKYGSNGYLEPLDAYFSDEEKAEWDDASYQAGVWDDVMYAAPENTSTQELYYNKTLLDEAGISLPENDENNRLTYEQVADLAKQALDVLDPDGSKGMVGFDFQQVSRVYQMNMLANSLGGKNISDDGYSLDGVINTEPWKDAMTWYQNLVNDGIASQGYDADTIGEQFYAGNMVFMVGGTWTPTNMKCDDEIDSTYAPCFEGHESEVATSTGSWYFGVNSQSKNKEEAAEFVKYFTLGEGSDMWLEINGDVPSRLDKQEEIMNDENASKAMKIAAYEAANTAYPRAVTPVFGEYSTVLNQAWEDVRNGADVDETLDNAVNEFSSAVAAYKK